MNEQTKDIIVGILEGMSKLIRVSCVPETNHLLQCLHWKEPPVEQDGEWIMSDDPVITVSAIAPNQCPKLTETDGLKISNRVSELFVNQLVKSAYFCGDDDRGCLNLSSPAGVVELQMFGNKIAQRGRRGAGNVVLGSAATISRIRALAAECNINVTITNNPFRQQTVVGAVKVVNCDAFTIFGTITCYVVPTMSDDIILCYYTSTNDAATNLHDTPLVITYARTKDDIQLFMTPTPMATSTTSLIPVVW